MYLHWRVVCCIITLPTGQDHKILNVLHQIQNKITL